MTEYKIVKLESLGTVQELEELLNAKGEAGWELCHLELNGAGGTKIAIFKKTAMV